MKDEFDKKWDEETKRLKKVKKGKIPPRAYEGTTQRSRGKPVRGGRLHQETVVPRRKKRW